MKRHFFIILCCCLSTWLFACDSSQAKSSNAEEKTAKATVDACKLLNQGEVDNLFGQSVGPGKADLPASHVSGCIWPADGIPKFILQVLPAPADLRKSLDMGNGYKVIDLEGHEGKAVAVIQLGKPEYNIPSGVAILGIVKGKQMLTLSPVMLAIQEESPQFTLLQELAVSAAGKL